MPGAYRLVIKTHTGHQIGVLTAYESLTYTKQRSTAGNAVLLAHYGVNAATDALLSQIVPDTILEVWRHPDPTDSSLDWSIDWIGFHIKPQKITESPVPVEEGTWQFKHITSLLSRRQVIPVADNPLIEEGGVAGLAKWRSTGLLSNAMRRLVRDHAVYPLDERRRIPGLYVPGDLPNPHVTGSGGLVWGDLNSGQKQSWGVMASYIWNPNLYISSYDSSPANVIYTTDGDTWSWNSVQPGRNIASFAVFNNGVDTRLYAGTCTQGANWDNGIWRGDAGANPPTAWTKVWSPSYCNVVAALHQHGTNLYAGTGWGRTYSGGFWYSNAKIVRSSTGAAWSIVFDGNTSGVYEPYDKYIAFEGLHSWGGHIYAGALYCHQISFGCEWTGTDWKCYTVVQYDACILRSDTGNSGSWVEVLRVAGPTITEPHPNGVEGQMVTHETPIDGFCCFSEFGGYLYAGIGDRWHPIDGKGRIYRTNNGTIWEQVFGANQDPKAEQSSHGVTWLTPHGGFLWAGMGGQRGGDGVIWWSSDGDNWYQSFEGRGYNYPVTHTLISFGGNLYAGFGWVPNVSSNIDQEQWYSGTEGVGKVWRMTASDGWDPPDWKQEASGRWISLLDILAKMVEWSMDTNGGLDFYLDPVDYGGATQEFMFMVVAPEDHRSTSTDPTIFGINRGNMAEPIYVLRDGDGPTMVYLLAEGQNEGRRVLEFHNVTAQLRSPWGRIEGTVNAQGVETPYEMYGLAWEALIGSGPIEQFGFKILQTPATRYGVEWNVGWLVTAQALGLTAHCKIESATVHLGTNPVVEEIETTIRLLELI